MVPKTGRKTMADLFKPQPAPQAPLKTPAQPEIAHEDVTPKETAPIIELVC